MEKYSFCSHKPWPLDFIIVSHAKEKDVCYIISHQKYLFMILKHPVLTHTRCLRSTFILSVSFSLREKPDLFLFLTASPFPPPVMYFHDHLQFMSSFSHCVLLWQDNSISLIQYALCLYLHAPVTVPLVREGAVSFSSSEVSLPSLLCLSLFQTAFSSASHKAAYSGFCLMILNGSFACSQMWGEYRKQWDCLYVFTN